MKTKCKTHIKNTDKDVIIEYDAIEECPKCNKALAPERLYNIMIEKEDGYYFYISDFCSSCKSVIISEYMVEIKKNQYGSISDSRATKRINSAPSHYEQEKFDESIENISPQFIKIYNQSLQAESIGLDEIAGLGYRKSVEFLIKDFAIYKNKEKEEEIKGTWMKACIDKYIDNEQIKILAERSDWIGNDEAHYVRKQKDRDVKDMKKFIKAMVYFIGMTLITEDAESMKTKKLEE